MYTFSFCLHMLFNLTPLFILGTSSIVDEKTHEPILSILTLIVETVARLRKDGHRVVLVSSGAVGVGLRRMDVDERPTYLPRIQVRRVDYLTRWRRDYSNVLTSYT